VASSCRDSAGQPLYEIVLGDIQLYTWIGSIDNVEIEFRFREGFRVLGLSHYVARIITCATCGADFPVESVLKNYKNYSGDSAGVHLIRVEQ
jgi:hypothetical protein